MRRSRYAQGPRASRAALPLAEELLQRRPERRMRSRELDVGLWWREEAPTAHCTARPGSATRASCTSSAWARRRAAAARSRSSRRSRSASAWSAALEGWRERCGRARLAELAARGRGGWDGSQRTGPARSTSARPPASSRACGRGGSRPRRASARACQRRQPSAVPRALVAGEAVLGDRLPERRRGRRTAGTAGRIAGVARRASRAAPRPPRRRTGRR